MTTQNEPATSVVAITDLKTLREKGVAWPSTYWQWHWCFRNRETNGLAAAFRRVGRRILVDPVKFMELTRAAQKKRKP